MSSCELALKVGFELLELLNRFENFRGLLRLRDQPILFLRLDPGALGSMRKANTGLPACFAASTSSHVIERWPSPPNSFANITVAVGHNADHRVGFGCHLHDFASRLARLRREVSI